MLTRLKLSALEMVGVLNSDPETFDPTLPVKQAHLWPASLPPSDPYGTTYSFNGSSVLRHVGRGAFYSRDPATVPTERGAALPLTEPWGQDGSAAAEVLRAHLLGQGPPPGKTRAGRRAESRITVHVGGLRLTKLRRLGDADIRALGVRDLTGGFTFREDALAFPTPQEALFDLWDRTHRSPLAAEDPYVWVIGWDAPTRKLTGGEAWRRIEGLTAELAGLDAEITPHEDELRVLKAARREIETRLARAAALDVGETPLTVGGYRIGRHGAWKLKEPA